MGSPSVLSAPPLSKKLTCWNPSNIGVHLVAIAHPDALPLPVPHPGLLVESYHAYWTGNKTFLPQKSTQLVAENRLSSRSLETLRASLLFLMPSPSPSASPLQPVGQHDSSRATSTVTPLSSGTPQEYHHLVPPSNNSAEGSPKPRQPITAMARR